MKPRTAIQREVCKLREQFVKTRKTSERDIERACKDAFEEVCYLDISHKVHKAYCLECGHVWEGSCAPKGKCPHCGRSLKPITTTKRTYHSWSYACVVTTFKGWQVLTYFYIRKDGKRGVPVSYHNYGEVIQRWVSRSGAVVTFALPRLMHAEWVNQPWALFGNMELRNNESYTSYGGYHGSRDIYDVAAGVYVRSLIPELRGVNWKDSYADSPYKVMWKLLYSPHYQTLMQAGQYALFHCADRDTINRYWPSMKICIRNHYYPKDGYDWFDLVKALDTCEKDLRNAHYVCPENLQHAHDKWITKKAKIDKDREASSYEKKYLSDKKAYLGMQLSIGDLTLRPLASIEEFKLEGIAMDHCVYNMGYYKKLDSLILSARKEGERIATIEYRISDGQILQVRGKSNSTTAYDSVIKSGLKKMRGTIIKYAQEHSK